MLSSRHGRTLHRLAAQLDADHTPGCIVDCGVWNGGSSILLASAAPSREIWAFDSFEGLPDPTAEDGPDSEGWSGTYRGAEAKAHDGFARFAPSAPVHIVKGWFDATLPAAKDQIGEIGLLHVDADWYESCRTVLDLLYPLVVPGGFVVIDDYVSWVGARTATEELLDGQDPRPQLVEQHWWQR